MLEVRFIEEASREFEAARLWYSDRSPSAAERFEAELNRLLGIISSNPALFPRATGDRRLAIFRDFPYEVVDRVTPEAIRILAVVHTSRSGASWKRRS